MVKGINLATLLWTDGDMFVPCDYRLYEKLVDGATKNDHFRAMLQTARERGFVPHCAAFDSWFRALDNLKLIRSYGWGCLTRLKRIRLRRSKALRLVNPERTGNHYLHEVELTETGTVVHLKGYGLITELFR